MDGGWFVDLETNGRQPFAVRAAQNNASQGTGKVTTAAIPLPNNFTLQDHAPFVTRSDYTIKGRAGCTSGQASLSPTLRQSTRLSRPNRPRPAT